MAEHDRDRMDEAQRAVRERNVVRDGGRARVDADIEDVTRDSYGASIGAESDDDRDRDDEENPARAREVLGIARDVTPDPDFAVRDDDAGHRRDDDEVDRRTDVDTSGSSYKGPDGLKVRD